MDKGTVNKSLINYLSYEYIPFHTPAHSGTENPNDLSELSGLDDLQYPSGIIRDSQALIEDLFNTQRSLFLVNGASVGIMAALLGLKNQKTKKILAPRNIHKSVINGVILAGFDIEWLDLKWLSEWGVYATAPEALESSAEYAGIIITNPSYEGHALSSLPEELKQIPIIIDEAHGAHYQFSSGLPKTALELGADIVIQSWHKTLGSLTQTGVLHVNHSSKIKPSIIEDNLRLLQTTSPSYLLMESLCSTAHRLAQHGEEIFSKTLELTSRIDNEFINIMPNSDPTRLMFKFKPQDSFIPGAIIDELFEEEKIALETSSYNSALALINYAHKEEHIHAFNKAAANVHQKLKSINFDQPKLDNFQPEFSEQVMNCREAFYSEAIELELDHASGKICQELYAPCPPGIPLFIPGQEITERNIELLKYQNSFLGEKEKKTTIKVVN